MRPVSPRPARRRPVSIGSRARLATQKRGGSPKPAAARHIASRILTSCVPQRRTADWSVGIHWTPARLTTIVLQRRAPSPKPPARDRALGSARRKICAAKRGRSVSKTRIVPLRNVRAPETHVSSRLTAQTRENSVQTLEERARRLRIVPEMENARLKPVTRLRLVIGIYADVIGASSIQLRPVTSLRVKNVFV